MTEEENKQETTKKITLGFILGWGFGAVALLSGVAMLFSTPLSGVLTLVLAAVLLPPANKFVAEKFNFSLSGGLKIVVVLVLLALIGMTAGGGDAPSNLNNSDTQEQQEDEIDQKEWYEVQTFVGSGNQDTDSFNISGDRVRITAITSGGPAGIGTFSSVSLESDSGDYLGPGLSISTEGAEDGHGNTIYRNLEPGGYYISVISGVDWEVKVEEYR